MATLKIADRSFVEINGYEVALVKTARVSIDDAATPADTMTRNYRSAGVKHGNKKITAELELDIPGLASQISAAVDDPGSNVNYVYECGGDRVTLHQLYRTSVGMNGSVGDASKSLAFGALDYTDENGALADAVLNIQLA